MTREEEINNASYSYWANNYANIEFIDEEEKELHTQDIQESFINGAEWADKHPRWISVEDELPPRNVFVLTCDGQENENLLMLAGDDRWYDKAVGLHRNITHWMPLPQPPKEGCELSNGKEIEIECDYE